MTKRFWAELKSSEFDSRPRAGRGLTLAHALIRFGRNALYNDDPDFCYTMRAPQGVGRRADRYPRTHNDQAVLGGAQVERIFRA